MFLTYSKPREHYIPKITDILCSASIWKEETSLVLINKPIALVKLQGACLLNELKQGSILVSCFDNGMLAAGRLDCRNGKVGIAAHGVVSCVEAQ
jgi:hypothetical protein